MCLNSDLNIIFLCIKCGILVIYVCVNIIDFKDIFNILKVIGFFFVGIVIFILILYCNL